MPTKQIMQKGLFGCFCLLLYLSSQQGMSQGYTRKSLTVLITEFGDDKPIPRSYFNSIQVSDRHDFNDIGTKTVYLDMTSDEAEGYTLEQLKRKIYEDRIPNKILQSILIDNATRAMTVANVQERGLYNASDNEMVVAQHSARGLDILKDAGVKLLSNIYFVVIKPTSYTTTYDAYSKGTNHEVSGNSYLFQLDLDSAYMAGKFWEDFYFDKSNATMYDKLMNHDFPLKETSSFFSVTVSDLDVANKVSAGLQMFANALANKQAVADESTLVKKSQHQIYGELIKKIQSESISSIESGEDFLLKGSVFKSHPLLSKVGKKENIKTDQLFEVLENVLDEETGKPREKHVGWVRAKRVADNRYRTGGVSPSSSFYRISSRRIRKGMLMKDYSAYDSNWTIGASYNTDSLSLLSGYFLNFEHITHGLPGLNIGVDIGYNPNLVTESLEYEDSPLSGALHGQALIGTLTLRQNFSYHRLVITPTFGAVGGYAFISHGSGFLIGDEEPTESYFSNNYDQVGGYLVGYLYGGDVGINLGRTLQLRAGVRFSDVLLSEFKSAKEAEYEFPVLTPTFKKQIFTFGLRFGRL